MTMPLELRKRILRDPKTRDELDAGNDRRQANQFLAPLELDLRSKKPRARKIKISKVKTSTSWRNRQSKQPIDAFLDLALGEDLETTFEDSTTQGDIQAVKEIFNNPHVLLGQSDAGAHVANATPGFGYSTIMLAHWVREHQIMSLEDAVKKLTFLPASLFGIHDRGLLRRGMAADVVVFDPEKIDLAEPEKVADLPEGAPRYIQRAKGIHYTIVNGSVLMKNGAHTGVYPGRVLRSV